MASFVAVPTLFATLDVHRPTASVTVEGTTPLRARLRRRVVVDDVHFFTEPTNLRAAKHQLHGCLRARGGTVHFPLYRLLGEMAAAGYALTACVAPGPDREKYVFATVAATPPAAGGPKTE